MTFSGLVSTTSAPLGDCVMWNSCSGFGAGDLRTTAVRLS